VAGDFGCWIFNFGLEKGLLTLRTQKTLRNTGGVEMGRAPGAGPDKSTGQAGGNVGSVRREGLSQGLKFFSGQA